LMETDANIPPILVGDPLRLGQILINLANNAVKFTEQGEVAVVTRMLAQTAHTVRLCFTVRDTGIGMTAQQQSELFRAFTQADASITRKFGGTGLGLAISKRLVEMMHGTIQAASTPGVGSQFTVELALGMAKAQWTLEHLRNQTRPDGAAGARAALAGARILLVEDNELNQQVAMELLEQAHITVLLAENGQQAVEMVSREPLDGLLMDMQMPVMDGLTATHTIRLDPRFATLPIIAMTANAMIGDRERCLAAGMQDHIAKPIEPDKLFSTLARWIKPASPLPASACVAARPVTDTPTAHTSSLPDIPGLHTQVGLAHTGGNPVTYLKLLEKFHANQQDAVQGVRAALAARDWQTAERLAHTLKGVAATIGADPLCQNAKQLEVALKDQADETLLATLLCDTAGELDRICAALVQALPAPPSDATPPEDPVATDAQITQRNALLRQAFAQLTLFDAAAEQTLAILRREHLSRALQPWLTRLDGLVGQYDFEAATTTLRACADALDVNLENP
ncbi:MAG: ATP-binding protein, partial [Magnetococcus sp. DMHC-8]